MHTGPGPGPPVGLVTRLRQVLGLGPGNKEEIETNNERTISCASRVFLRLNRQGGLPDPGFTKGSQDLNSQTPEFSHSKTRRLRRREKKIPTDVFLGFELLDSIKVGQDRGVVSSLLT